MATTDSDVTAVPTGRPQFTCPSCDQSQAWNLWRRVRGFQLFECGGCGLITWDFTKRDALRLYREGYFESDDLHCGYEDYAGLEEPIRRNALTRVDRLARYATEIGVVLPQGQGVGSNSPLLVEVGCAYGFFMQEAQRSGYRVRGVEPSLHGSEHARSILGLDVVTGTLENLNQASGSVDVIVMWDVIEHVADQRALLAQCGSLLKPGGLIAFSTGDVRSFVAKLSGAHWHLYSLPEHLFFFSPHVVRRMLARAGFADVKISHPASVFRLDYLAERMRRTAWPGWFWRRLSLPQRVRNWQVPMNLWDVMEVVARKGKSHHP